jgi:hypothetical protein
LAADAAQAVEIANLLVAYQINAVFLCVDHIQQSKLRGEQEMNQFYYDTVTQMEQLGVDDEYIQGWQCGFLQNPKREDQRLTEAYETGYNDGEEKNTDNFGEWVKD